MDGSASKKSNFTQIPNLVDELNLSPLAYCLYVHYSRAFFEFGFANDSVRALAKKYKVGFSAIKKAKTELEKHGLIKVKTFPAAENRPDEIEVVDIWERNQKHFADRNPVTNEKQDNDNLLPNKNRAVVDKKQPVTNGQRPNKELRLKKDFEEESLSPRGREIPVAEILGESEEDTPIEEFSPTRAIEIYREIFPTYQLDGQQVKDFAAMLPEVEESVWRQNLIEWRTSRWKAQNISGMVKRYKKELKDWQNGVNQNGISNGKNYSTQNGSGKPPAVELDANHIKRPTI